MNLREADRKRRKWEAFFFEKKNPKTFIRTSLLWHQGARVRSRAALMKSFCFFFFRKKRFFLCFLHQSS